MVFGDAALFAEIQPEKAREDYYFVFYSERMDMMWVFSSKEFIEEAVHNKTGKNKDKRLIWFNGKNTKENREYYKSRLKRYLA